MIVEFNNMNVIGDFGKNNFSGAVVGRNLIMDPKT